MVVGPMDSGKSSCCRTLLNYAVDGGWNPTFVDVDAGQQGLALPGSIAAAILRANIASDGRVEFFQRYDLPFGRLRLDEDTKLYKSQAENLAAAVLRNVGKSTHLDASGVIINTAGWIDEQGFGALVHIASEFKVNKILVLESESLGHRFQVWASEAEVALEVFYAKKPTCLMERTIETRRDYRDFVVLGAFSVNGQVLPPYMIPLNSYCHEAIFTAVYLRSGKKIAVCNQVEFPAHCRDRVLAVSSAPHLEVDVKKYPVRGYAVLVSFDSYRNEAMIVSTLDLHQLPGTIVLLRGEVNASVLREHIPCADLGR